VRTFMVGGDEFLVISEPVDPPPNVSLTQTELVVAKLVAKGLSNAAIAQKRGTSERTVANQVAALLRKVGVPSRHHIGRALGI
jgi:DNA-binding NarL/FixJ family response regulator